MPIYNCKALTPQGRVVKSKVEESSRLACIRKLKRNGLTPISVSQTLTIKSSKRKATKTRKNLKPEANLSKSNNKKQSKNRKAQRRHLGKIKYRRRWRQKNNR